VAPGGLEGFHSLNRHTNMLTFTEPHSNSKTTLLGNDLVTKARKGVLLDNDLITKACRAVCHGMAVSLGA